MTNCSTPLPFNFLTSPNTFAYVSLLTIRPNFLSALQSRASISTFGPR